MGTFVQFFNDLFDFQMEAAALGFTVPSGATQVVLLLLVEERANLAFRLLGGRGTDEMLLAP